MSSSQEFSTDPEAGKTPAPEHPKARELLAVAYDRGGYPAYANLARKGYGEFTGCALLALSTALREIDELREALAKCDPHDDHKCLLCGRPDIMHAPDCLWLRAVVSETSVFKVQS